MLVTCYLCGKNYGRYVFPAHHNKCRNVWEEKEKKKPRSERSPVPAGPPHLVQVLAGSAGEEGLELYNQRALAVWNKEVLEECRHWSRTFLPSQLLKHQKCCTKKSPLTNIRIKNSTELTSEEYEKEDEEEYEMDGEEECCCDK